MEGAGDSSLGTPGGRWGVAAPVQSRGPDPLGIKDLCRQRGKSTDPLSRKMHICTLMHYLRGQFQEIPRPSGIHKFPRGLRLVFFGRGTP